MCALSTQASRTTIHHRPSRKESRTPSRHLHISFAISKSMFYGPCFFYKKTPTLNIKLNENRITGKAKASFCV
jgi:hypothetical protein